MAYDETLAERARALLASETGFSEKRMFGGICFLLDGNMCCGVAASDLMVRVGEEGDGAAMRQPHARRFDLSGRPMKGWLLVAPAGTSGAGLKPWIARGVAFARTLPAKAEAKPKPARGQSKPKTR